MSDYTPRTFEGLRDDLVRQAVEYEDAARGLDKGLTAYVDAMLAMCPPALWLREWEIA
jgi:hypothetical protein